MRPIKNESKSFFQKGDIIQFQGGEFLSYTVLKMAHNRCNIACCGQKECLTNGYMALLYCHNLNRKGYYCISSGWKVIERKGEI